MNHSQSHAGKNENVEIFHTHERAAQLKAGSAERMAIIGPKVIRPFMPDQHREFFEQLPMVFIGAVDGSGDIWASVLFGDPGFVQSATELTLSIRSGPSHLDPLAGHITEGTDIGLLGVELETRRRNRVNASVASFENGQLLLDVKQSFGNCPKYIQLREPEAVTYKTLPEKTVFQVFDKNLNAFISNADTFFIASQFDDGSKGRNRGVDVSHRGGLPGFIQAEDESTLQIPDYAGNNFFNTIGNMMSNPKVGLLFLDYETGRQISLTGKAETIWASDEPLPFENIDRMIRFKLNHGFVITNILPFRWALQNYSPFAQAYAPA